MSAILNVQPLGFPWRTLDPFLFCVHHLDAYPRGNEQLGPVGTLEGRDLGQDFGRKDGWSMYHGRVVPGFPQHPHRGFETVTVVRSGVVDHSDSLGATARFGQGDAQWLTAGRGIVHCEMFPLIERERPNPLELFQIWLNLPAADKLVEPHFSMLWAAQIPTVEHADAAGRHTCVTVVAGALSDAVAPRPPPRSWAAKPDNDVCIWTIRMQPRAEWTLPAARPTSNRLLSYFAGDGVRVEAMDIARGHSVQLRADAEVRVTNGEAESELLLLQGRPINEPVASYGPFVMNSMPEIQQAFLDYRRTEFGGWPWKRDDPVHPRESGRFARHVDGRVERP